MYMEDKLLFISRYAFLFIILICFIILAFRIDKLQDRIVELENENIQLKWENENNYMYYDCEEVK